jgi:uncharacterized protein YndB with AHSA1/START domain
MTEFEVSRGMPAVGEVVFQTASDPARFAHWLPQQLDVEPTGPDAVHVESEVGGHHEAEGLLRAQPEQLRVEWANEGSDEYSGWLQVADSGAGSSEATLHLSFADAAVQRASGEQVEQSMREALDRLAGEVISRTDGAP